MRVPQPFSHPRPGLKKPMVLTSLAVLGLFLSAVFIGYLESPAPSIAIVTDHKSQQSSRAVTPVAKTDGQLAHDKSTVSPSRIVSSRTVRRSRNRSATPSTARLHRKSADSSRHAVVARTQDSKRTSNEKSPKIVAVLKTTWRVLKKPFDF
ncbi:MAG TPA: hypothetical protein VFX97_02815 [Pyrinomonadaceae bacterium]|nr:hypothetical protein [Pyrinomonadaceae bacterium]